ncbi:hypothetical protein DCO58_01665 [Helicobacter saguini]|uniref:GTP cyclohydrolase 1 type 2 homolog n=1 Tax=Helicobacter saguini TaxID=1548018 RepID=A0A347W042_9HELI|nr:Nif3-like dinuclear metal center hexameric protein [Helicobacter saguini]MWV62910.1 hypothetical protein [Helicobacter saguini]MWV66420.1 hypothetical protein [Helicobacter saguini]MWV68771.1 hypothetical protein [Helicobacter saguini]MWV71675.1 hypothetical protein [Helicobacter saguini]TLD94476.1 Nif3-like dinuclear metal center hexameric protein [Helicobacter saguini]
MKIKEIYDILNEIAPFETQASWDNSGLNVGSFETNIDRIYVALELDSKVLDFILEYNNFDKKLGNLEDSNIMQGSQGIFPALDSLPHPTHPQKNIKQEKCPANSKEDSKENLKSYKNHNFSTLLITHHPVIFKPIKNFNTQIYPCNLIERCIKENISVISLHTNFDLAHLNRAFADSLNLESLGFEYSHDKDFSIIYSLEKLENIESNAEQGSNKDSKKLENIESNLAPINNKNTKKVTESITLESIISHIKKILNLQHLKYVTNDLAQKIKNIHIICGSGASFISSLKSGDLLITGDIKYHDAMIADSQNISLIEISHYKSEHIFAPLMAKILQKYNIQAIISNSHNPFCYA